MSKFISEKQIDNIAEFLSDKVDLSYFRGSAERIIFKGFVSTIIRSAEKAIPKEWGILFLSENSGITEKQADPIIEWLINTVNEHVRLPFVNENSERLIIPVIILFVNGMIKGQNLDSDMVFNEESKFLDQEKITKEKGTTEDSDNKITSSSPDPYTL